MKILILIPLLLVSMLSPAAVVPLADDGKLHVIGPETKPGTYGIDAVGADEGERGGKRKHQKAERSRDAHTYDSASASSRSIRADRST